MKEKRKIKELQLLSAIGFAGKVVGGLHQHRDRGLIYPVGVGVGVWDRAAGRHALLHSHNRPITAMAISRGGNLIVSAQNSDPGCQAKVVIWDYKERAELGSYCVHREEVAAVAVSAGEEIVVSLGGPLDGYLVVWHVESKKPLCSVVAGDPGLGLTTLLCTAPVTPTLMLVGGQKLLRAWTLNSSNNRLMPTPIAVGLLERNYTCLQVDAAEEHLYASTTTGDVVKIRLNMVNGKSVSGGAVLVAVMAPKPTPIPGGPKLSRAPTPGIQIMVVLPGGDIIVGEMGGTLRAYRQLEKKSEDGRPICAPPPRAHGTVKYTHPKDPTQPLLSQIWSVAVGSTITSLSLVGDLLVVGTAQSEMHELVLPSTDDSSSGGARGSARTPRTRPARRPSAETKANRHTASNGREKKGDKNIAKKVTTCESNGERDVGMIARVGSAPPEVHLLSTCHPDPLHDVTFPRGVGDLVVSAGVGGIRVWNVRSLDEMLRVSLPGLVCCCCCVTHTLHTIVTGWSDGRLRGLGAESGRVVWTVDDAHHGGVNTITTLNSGKVVSGGRDGRVRVWEASGAGMRMTASQKEHRGDVTHLALAPDEDRVLSCSGDGTCILWELPSLSRLYTLAAHVVFLGGSVLRSGEMVTVGSDGSVLVWDRHDGSLLADLPAATRPITTITASPDDAVLVTAGEDAIIRVWNWVKGRITHEGRGHSGAITKASLSPDGKVLSTVGKDGAILFWKIP